MGRQPDVRQKQPKLVPIPGDGYLESDSEVDEFAHEVSHDGEDDEGVGGLGQWEPDAWDEEEHGSMSDQEGGSLSEEESAEGADAEQLDSLQSGLARVPFSTLLKAQKVLGKGRPPVDDTERPEESADAGPSRQPLDKVREMKRQLAELQRRKGKAVAVVDDGEEDDAEDSWTGSNGRVAKRDSKNAPATMSTKKQVSRHRQIIDTQKSERRDPRFSSVSAGPLDPSKQGKSYGFLDDMLRDEFDGLKLAVKTAIKAENSCPLSQKPARTAEREALERQLAQARSRLERSARETRERGVLSAAKKQEKEKRQQGKGAWYLKKSAQRDLLLKSRFETLEKEGGRSAVKKALEKKRKKTAAKEKKSRPFARGTA